MHRDYCRGISEGSRRVKPAMQDDADRRDAV